MTIYLLIALLVVWIELDFRINTDSMLEKIGLCLIGVGSICSIDAFHIDSPDNLIIYGIFVYLVSISLKVFKRRKRASDKRETAHRPV